MEKVYIRRGDKIVGPTTRENLIKLYENRKVTDADQVSTDQKNWMLLIDFLNPAEEAIEEEDPIEPDQETQVEDYENDNNQSDFEDSAVNISSKKQEKAMWTATLVIGMGGAGICALALVLGFIFGFLVKNGDRLKYFDYAKFIPILAWPVIYTIFLIICMTIFSGFKGLPVRVLQKFRIHKSANGTPLIRVVGRTGGLISFLLTIFGLSDQTHFELFEDRIFYRSNRHSIQIVNTVMLDHVNCTICTLYQPIWALVWGALQLLVALFLLLGGLVAWPFVDVDDRLMNLVLILSAFMFGIFTLISAYFFWTNRFLVMGIKTSSGDTFGIVFKRSIIENIEVDFGKVRNAMRLVDEKILAAK